jgi:hypothetical protein
VRLSGATPLMAQWGASLDHYSSGAAATFDVLAEGLISKNSRGDRRWTFPNDFTGMWLFHAAIALERPFTAEELQVPGGGQAF